MHSNVGLYKEFTIRTQENQQPNDIDEEEWTADHPLCWNTENFLKNFNSVALDAILQEKCIDENLILLDAAPQLASDAGATDLVSKQHCTWIADMLHNSWTDIVASEMKPFEEETQGDGVILSYVFLHENAGFTNESIITAEQHLTREKLSLVNFQFPILSPHVYLQCELQHHLPVYFRRWCWCLLRKRHILLC